MTIDYGAPRVASLFLSGQSLPHLLDSYLEKKIRTLPAALLILPSLLHPPADPIYAWARLMPMHVWPVETRGYPGVEARVAELDIVPCSHLN